jgi:hypothetical protein
MEKCENLQVMCQDLENYWTQTKQAITDYRHRLGDCFCNCWEIKKECKDALVYFQNKAWIIINENKNERKGNSCTT